MLLKLNSIILLYIILLIHTFSLNSFGAQVTYTYDSLNRVTSVDYGDGATEDYTYDAAGNRTSMVVNVTDTDGDTIGDYMDNCYLTPNAGQEDTDYDGYGNACDCDLDNDGFVGPFDYTILRAAWWSNTSSANWNADADFDSDGFVGPFDFTIFRNRWWTSEPWD